MRSFLWIAKILHINSHPSRKISNRFDEQCSRVRDCEVLCHSKLSLRGQKQKSSRGSRLDGPQTSAKALWPKKTLVSEKEQTWERSWSKGLSSEKEPGSSHRLLVSRRWKCFSQAHHVSLSCSSHH